jgi:putative NIF3 family GTP cyclohydrolase 1 type 2
VISDDLFRQLDSDFIIQGMSDDWAQYMDDVADFLCDNFTKRSMGLVCDFTTEINRVYTAVFPSPRVMQRILDDGTQDAMLFVHHPSIWDIRQAPNVFQQMDRELLQQFKDRRIAIYNLHVPLDHFGEYSTSVTLAKVLGIKPEKAFGPYFGAMAGVFGTTDCVTVQGLRSRLQGAVNHEVSLYNYGDKEIKAATVAVMAGGGNDVDTLTEIYENGVNVFVTGISVNSDFFRKAHEYAEKHGVNILGGTHYSTEMFACMSMVDYFTKSGLDSLFIEDVPVMEDI